LELAAADLQRDLDRRKPGQSRHTTQRRESDTVEILSGVFEGRTTGAPIGLLIRNEDQRSKDYSEIAARYRPGHADYTYDQKYGRRDYRGGGRSSARETAVRVAAGAIAKKYLAEHAGIGIRGYLSQLGPIRPEGFDWDQVERNPFFWPCADTVPRLEDLHGRAAQGGRLDRRRRDGRGDRHADRSGRAHFRSARRRHRACHDEHQCGQGVEIGAGFRLRRAEGDRAPRPDDPEGFLSNHAGGILGGISSGQDVVVRIALKPTSSIRLPGRTIDSWRSTGRGGDQGAP
jgi:chorismate synthase